jgi:hypothetical protein
LYPQFEWYREYCIIPVSKQFYALGRVLFLSFRAKEGEKWIFLKGIQRLDRVKRNKSLDF